jgi:hypothetical protein
LIWIKGDAVMNGRERKAANRWRENTKAWRAIARSDRDDRLRTSRAHAGARRRIVSMKNMLTYWEQLKADAAECARIRDLATDESTRNLYARLAAHLDVLAAQLERVLDGKDTAH